MLKDNQSNSQLCYKNLRQTLRDEEKLDGEKRAQFGNQWQRPPSQQINGEYYKNIESTACRKRRFGRKVEDCKRSGREDS